MSVSPKGLETLLNGIQKLTTQYGKATTNEDILRTERELGWVGGSIADKNFHIPDKE